MVCFFFGFLGDLVSGSGALAVSGKDIALRETMQANQASS